MERFVDVPGGRLFSRSLDAVLAHAAVVTRSTW